MKNSFVKWIVKHKHVLSFSFILLVTFISIFISRQFYRDQIVSWSFHVSSFFQRGASETEQAIDKGTVNLMSKKALIAENRRLQERVEELEKALASKPNIEHYAFLDNQIKNNQIISEGYTPQPVIIMTRQLSPSGTTFVLSKGSSVGIQKNDPVVAVQDGKIYLAGRIYSTTHFAAIYWPIFNYNSYIGARLLNGREEGILQGGGTVSDNLELTRIETTAEETIHYGDPVVTSGLNSFFPPGILIGSVTQMEKNVEAPSLKISVKPFLDFKKVEVLYVLTKPEVLN